MKRRRDSACENFLIEFEIPELLIESKIKLKRLTAPDKK